MLQWVIAPEYYLYRHAFKAKASDSEGSIAANLVVPDGLAKTDEFFGDVEVYYDALRPLLPWREQPSWRKLSDLPGCADAGLCYPPETKSFLGTWHPARFRLAPSPQHQARSTPVTTPQAVQA